MLRQRPNLALGGVLVHILYILYTVYIIQCALLSKTSFHSWPLLELGGSSPAGPAVHCFGRQSTPYHQLWLWFGKREGCRRKNRKNYGVNRTTVHQPPVAVLKGMLYTMLYCILCIYGISYNIISYTLIYLHVKQRRLVVVCWVELRSVQDMITYTWNMYLSWYSIVC